MKKICLIFCILWALISGCSAQGVKQEVSLLEVPFEKQKEWYCGAAAVSEIFRYYGDFITQDSVASRLFSRKRGGILNIDLTLFLRDRKYFTRTLSVSGYSSKEEKQQKIDELLTRVKKFIDSGHPVIALIGPDVRDFFGFKVRIFAGPFFYLSDYEGLVRYNHYIVLTGYSDTEEVFYCHDGVSPNVRMTYREILKRWRATGFWALVAVPPESAGWELTAEEALDAGVLLERSGKYHKALEKYDTAAQLAGESNPDLLPMIRFNRANVYISLREFAKAEAILNELRQSDFQKGPVLNNLAEIFSQKGVNLEKGEQLVREAIQADQKNILFYTDTYAMLLLKRGHTGKAGELLEKVVDRGPNPRVNAVLWFHLGEVYRTEGRDRDAFNAFERAIELTDENDDPEQESRYSLEYSITCLKLGERAKAKQGLLKAVALDYGETGWRAKELLRELKAGRDILEPGDS